MTKGKSLHVLNTDKCFPNVSDRLVKSVDIELGVEGLMEIHWWRTGEGKNQQRKHGIKQAAAGGWKEPRLVSQGMQISPIEDTPRDPPQEE